ncbi:hypothetical protein [Glycomyces buryatensis]|uniref:Uncharacterized protein n=1 Tax=Glycomyces buryatensis TaxID=2570927 RepID=A0A4V4HSM1_9ACTN|nr:hypothetical protein [Glycomyces buryatensis]THV42256.1 hypothetical protein FAB82_07275 [Glycomyces buryatensis]
MLLDDAGDLSLFNGHPRLALHLFAQSIAANPVVPRFEDTGRHYLYCRIAVVFKALGDATGAAWAAGLQDFTYLEEAGQKRIRDAIARADSAGLGLAGAGVLLLAIGSMIPQVSFDGSDEELSYLPLAGLGGVVGGLPGLAPAILLIVIVGWTAVGIKPGLQWTAKLGGIGLALTTIAASFQPVQALNSLLEDSEDADIEAAAGGGIWLYVLAAILLAVSIFMMRWAPRPQTQIQQVPQHQPQPGPYNHPQQ